ncbi:F-box domain-containing protein [Westerdykella ornata]|uniref:F-box domain-containing protein n=1 Tax=Westerdykella ornata TaxID=318751 RepID=A0A6A6J751_WESOR|nr:F-box domain-containing protein [Westerdykella ornata]KAF2271828.1 F-box domain-containing protein [Westerdykella ornata]
MTERNFSDDEIFLYLSHRPHYILDGVISVDESTKLVFTTIQRECRSTLGQLDNLPLEILHESFRYLDLQSLSRLSRVSLRGKAVVESLPVYRDLAKSAGHTFEILNRARILSLHSVTTLHAALYTERCISCGAYGAFLLLLSAERCCFLCLVVNQSLWMLPLPAARECFGLTKQQLKALPIMWSIPGKYCVPRSKSRQRSIRLTSVKAAKELALKVHGSIEALEMKHPLDPQAHPAFKTDMLTWYRQAPLCPLSQDPLTINDVGIRPDNVFGGMGAIPFPSLLNGGTEQGLWCRGCEMTYDTYMIEGLDVSTLSRLVPQGCPADLFLLRVQYRAWSKAGFLQHAKHCHSAAAVISQRWIGLT